MNKSFMIFGDPESFDVTLKHACKHAESEDPWKQNFLVVKDRYVKDRAVISS